MKTIIGSILVFGPFVASVVIFLFLTMSSVRWIFRDLGERFGWTTARIVGLFFLALACVTGMIIGMFLLAK